MSGTPSPSLQFSGFPGWLIFILSLVLSMAAAEGSSELLVNGSYRASLETGNTNTGDLGAASPKRKTSLFVYAKTGEVLALGSSSMLGGLSPAAAINVYAGEVNLTNGSALTPVKTCAPTTTKVGYIETRLQETSGPNIVNTNGYIPCTYTVPSTNVYTVEFLAPSPTADKAPTANTVGNAWPVPTATDSSIAAWDVTVVQNGSTAVPGRVWTTYLAMNSGGNSRSVGLKLYVQTKDGYRYKVTQDLDPYGFVFFANNKGVTNSSSQATFQSTTVASATYGTPVVGLDSGTDVTHKLFFNVPDSTLPATVGTDWLRTSAPTLPPTPSGLTFTGREGNAGYAGSASGFLLGGTFTFTNSSAQAFSYRLTIPLSGSGSNTNRILTGVAKSGTNTVDWDGLDGDGKAVPAGSNSYTASVTLFAGDVHFPLLDSENAVGLKITRETLSDSSASMIYWDDRLLTRTNGVSNGIAGAPSPDVTPNGADSSSISQHSWSSSFGDKKLMDTWAYYPGSPATASNTVQVRTADISIIKTASATTAARGGKVTYTLTVQNLTASTPGQPLTVTVADALPSWASASSWRCPIGCAVTSGTGALSTVVTLNNQTPVVLTVTTNVPSTTVVGSNLINTATVSRANDATDPDTTNNTSSVTVTARDPVTKLDLVKMVRNVTNLQATGSTSSVATPGDLLEYVVRYTNNGDLAISNLSLKDSLAVDLTPVGAVLVCPSGTPVTLTATQNYVVALNSFCGAGTQVGAGESGTLTLTARVR
ncbi:hypothetical protein DKM44_05905 [Deinococcus irradiatisoli]|uniref:DUF11 domain-containing protein n=1 Tax=Deinococcus irradiatisoli TaxID=2202254 RepID=A0A2Z3JFQ4_9DEIO|nr:DUF11 domain-containing protein [Deinococcus irradiatisoli]AWN22816.1 hypothetical protein DKM44_05905 [Deinococcus irradiatisoli]